MAIQLPWTGPNVPTDAPQAYAKIRALTIQIDPDSGTAGVAIWFNDTARQGNRRELDFKVVDVPPEFITALKQTNAFKAIVAQLYQVVKADPRFSGGVDV